MRGPVRLRLRHCVLGSSRYQVGVSRSADNSRRPRWWVAAPTFTGDVGFSLNGSMPKDLGLLSFAIEVPRLSRGQREEYPRPVQRASERPGDT